MEACSACAVTVAEGVPEVLLTLQLPTKEMNHKQRSDVREQTQAGAEGSGRDLLRAVCAILAGPLVVHWHARLVVSEARLLPSLASRLYVFTQFCTIV